jgi:phosphatidylethanolamine-binding protein (PEBP) family uncharacterized protein
MAAKYHCGKVAATLLIAGFAFSAFAQVNIPVGGFLTFDVTINTNFPANTFAVTNQALLTATGVTLNSDDPATALTNDPTITTLSVAPVISSCPGNQGTCGNIAAFLATAVGGDSPPVITYKFSGTNITSPFTFPVASNVVTVTASNGVLPNATCTFSILVLDKEIPSISCPGNITNNTAPGLCSAVVNYAVTSSDNCPGSVLVQNSGLASGSVFPKGMTSNRFTVTDAAGNTNSCTFLVVVQDKEAPSITCPGNIVVSNTPDLCTAIVNYSVTSTDNCPGQVAVRLSGLASGAAFPKGITTNVWVVTDASQNTNTCSFTVTVLDAEAPQVTCPGDIFTNLTDV